MELLYVIELDCKPSETSTLDAAQVPERLATHIADWLNHEHRPELAPSAFEIDGSTTLISELEDQRDTRVAWMREGTKELHALVVTIRTAITRSGHADFVCVVTVSEREGRTAVRIEMGRESLDGVLAPAGANYFRRPFLLILLLRDSDLQFWSGPNKVDGRFNWVNPRQTDYVWRALSNEKRRIPVLLVDGGADSGEQLAFRAAGELAGLASVLAVDARSQAILENKLNEYDATIPPGGARLVWPDLTLRHPGFTADQATFAVGRLLRLLSSVSVSARGTNHLLQAAQAARREARNRELTDQLEAARALGDVTSENDAQATAIESLKNEIDEYATWLQQLEEERDGYKAQAAQATYWRHEAERARREAGVRENDWSEAPQLASTDLSELASFLEERSDGAIVFTRNAYQSWKRCAYPHVQVMQDALVTLTRAALEYRRLRCDVGMQPDDWFKLEWDLHLASTDKYMSQNKMDKFSYDGTTYSRLPHLKLGDHTSPNAVGRVYFAMDADGERFIVDHVGLKLYGL